MEAPKLTGFVVAITSPDASAASQRAAAVGKLGDKGPVMMYYRKLGSRVLTALVPTTYPQTVLDAASAVTASQAACVVSGYDVDWRDGELMLLLASASPQLKVVESPLPEKTSSMLAASGLGDLRVVGPGACAGDISSLEPLASEGEGLVLVDRSFNVKGVGLVMLGFSKLGSVAVHDEFIAIPSMKKLSVKSIEVLDEPVDEVGPDVRVGLALKGASLEEVEGTYLLVRSPDQVVSELVVSVKRFPWSDDVKPGRLYHLSALGVVVPAMATSVEGERAKFKASRPLPRSGKYVLIDVNAKPPRPRVIGWVEPLSASPGGR